MKPSLGARKLRKARMDSGKSQEEFAKSLGITQSYTSQIESGMRRPGSIRLLSVLERRYGITPKDFVR